MVRTGARAQVLGNLLTAAGYSPAAHPPPPPRLPMLTADARDTVEELYRALGGRQDQPLLRPGPWDLTLTGDLVVELDEELHFNRYRARTLEGSWAEQLPWRDAYLAMCEQHEAECLDAGSWGKRWTNESCEKMFGPPAQQRNLDATGGAPRWKQRALYDAIKDAAGSMSEKLHLARLSVFDEVGGVPLGAVLDKRCTVAPHHLRALVETRAA